MFAPLDDHGQAAAAGTFLALVFAALFGLLLFGSWQAGVLVVAAFVAGVGVGIRGKRTPS